MILKITGRDPSTLIISSAFSEQVSSCFKRTGIVCFSIHAGCSLVMVSRMDNESDLVHGRVG